MSEVDKKPKKKTRKGKKSKTEKSDSVIKERNKNIDKVKAKKINSDDGTKKKNRKKKDDSSEDESGYECDCGCFVENEKDKIENPCCDSNSCKKCFNKYESILTPIIKQMEINQDEDEKIEDEDKVCSECVAAEYFEIFMKYFKKLKINKGRYEIFEELFADHQLTEKQRKLLKLLAK